MDFLLETWRLKGQTYGDFTTGIPVKKNQLLVGDWHWLLYQLCSWLWAPLNLLSGVIKHGNEKFREFPQFMWLF